ncbi:MAG: sodium:proton antiporter [Oligoflexia bacterium]|nr:sodium:proton antiporter [Oligoflexia bacterium]
MWIQFGGMQTHLDLPIWSIAPFLAIVLSVAILPVLAPRFWHRYHHLLLAMFAIPVIALCAAVNYHWVVHSFVDYVIFICLLGALYSIGGSLLVVGTPKANPVTNLAYMAFGAIIANFIGTLGASMLLIRPLLRSNRGRKHEVHVIVFFIFIVSNVGGLLTPLGDPPLLLGYIMGVPFWWTLKLFPVWFFVVTSLLGIFAALDSYYYLHDPDFRGPMKQELVKETIQITGRWNLALIPVVMAALILPQAIPHEYEMWRHALRATILIGVVYVSGLITPKIVRTLNNFSWEPFKEVAMVFAAIFATMIPAIKYLELHATQLGVQSAWSFYWLSGIFSGILDNAPTYASFFALAQGLGKDVVSLTLENGTNISETLLTAISCGAVFFGGLTYIGNAPNLLIKAVAEDEKVKMPSFFGFLIWSFAFLVPVLFMTAVLFFE